ncbi:MAG: VCBS repeat-containing protein [Rubrimonas sp.]|uniref:FG-GAP repeat domain-containing protein n=1 Tax=Rubrimonas sp. TaxID=2036015 RepID=UPI002FDD3D44
MSAALLLAAAVAGGGAFDAAPSGCAGPRTRAYYMMPTERYPHGALGDTLEWGGLVYDGEVYAGHVLTREFVFEDTEPRLADFDGDCAPEVVVVESHETEGAQLAVYAIDRGRLLKIAATPHIGARFRWLAPAGIADFDRDGDLDVAFVRTPHLGGTLEFWGFAAGGLTRLGAVEGVTNHRFGDAAILGGARDCGDGAEVVVADQEWGRTLAARLEDGAVSLRALAEDARPETLARALACG